MSDYLDKINKARRQGNVGAAGVTIIRGTAVVNQVPKAPSKLDPAKKGGIDTDLYAGAVDFPQAKSNGVSFAVIRVGQGGLVMDQQLPTSQANAKGVVKRDYYWYLDLHQPISAQAADCLRYINGDFDSDSILFADFEDEYSFGHAVNFEHLNSSHVLQFFNAVSNLEPKLKLGVYTTRVYWQTYGATDPFWGQYALWLSLPAAPYQAPLPLAPWATWHYHQWSFTGDESLYGAPDLNYQNPDTTSGTS